LAASETPVIRNVRMKVVAGMAGRVDVRQT
jgi:hypothetical protein